MKSLVTTFSLTLALGVLSNAAPRGGRGGGGGNGSGVCGKGACAVEQGGCMIETVVPKRARPAGKITGAQREELLVLHEEEKLARDVYNKLGEKYPLNPFKNIPRSEENHIDATADLLKYHDIPVPEKGKPGEYDSGDLQKLYRKLVKRGGKSEIEALKVGALVEEVDIKDLRAMAADAPSKVAKALAEQLEAASYNHLRAFVRNLQARGVDYEPEVLKPALYKEIVGDADDTRGGGRGPGAGRGRGQGQGQGQGRGRGQGRGFRGGRS